MTAIATATNTSPGPLRNNAASTTKSSHASTASAPPRKKHRMANDTMSQI